MSFRSNDLGSWVYSHEEHEAHEHMVANVERPRAENAKLDELREAQCLHAEMVAVECAEAHEEIERVQETIDSLRVENAELRESLRQMVKHLEYEGQQGDGIAEGAWDDYHAARFMLEPKDLPNAAERGLVANRLKVASPEPGAGT
jgi:hypothetical protein